MDTVLTRPTRLVFYGLVALISGCVLTSGYAMAAGADEFGWIVGDWIRDGRRGEIHESWQQLSDQTFEGRSWIVSSVDGRHHPIESLLLVEMEGVWFYIPKVAENEYPVPFRLTSIEADRLVFENPNHDFPQKIIYQRNGDDNLLVTIEGPVHGEESRQADFQFRRSETP